MTIVVATVVGFVAGRLLWLAMRKSWNRPVFQRTNFQGNKLPTAAGLVLPLALLLVEAGRAVAAAVGIGDGASIYGARAGVLIAVSGFALLGLLDDLAGGGDARGFAGHMRALSRGQLTSGGIKMLGGIVVALVAATAATPDAGAFIIVNAVVIALAANLANLFDLRPGRVAKVGLIAYVLLAAISGLPNDLVGVAVIAGAVGALVLDDLRERLMLGDTGANVIGAALGVGLITQVGRVGALISLLVLVGFNLLSEFVSFSKIIESVKPLRAFDMLGQRRTVPIDVREQAPAPADESPKVDSPLNVTERATVGGAHDDGEQRAGEARSPDASRGSRPFLQEDFQDRFDIDGDRN